MSSPHMAGMSALMKEARVGMLATTDGRRATVRPIGGWMWRENELWVSTATGDDKATDIAKCPDAEMAFCLSDGRHIRIAGPCRLSVAQADRDAIFKEMPWLAQYLGGPDRPDFGVIRMEPKRLRLFDMDSLGYADVPVDSPLA